MRTIGPLLLLFSVMQIAQAAPTAAAAERALADIAAQEQKLEDGLAARDVKLLDPLLADPFTWVHSSDGRVDARDNWLASAGRGMALTGQRNKRTEHGATVQTYGDGPHTAIRVARVQIVDTAGSREIWLRQTHTWVRNAAGAWQLAMGQGVVMYEGPLLDHALHARYAGTYVLGDGRKLVLEWTDGALLATFPNGARTQVFLASPTEEAMRNLGVGGLHFTLGEQGVPSAASLVRDSKEIWRATRQ